jgi:hypothetical protein
MCNHWYKSYDVSGKFRYEVAVSRWYLALYIRLVTHGTMNEKIHTCFIHLERLVCLNVEGFHDSYAHVKTNLNIRSPYWDSLQKHVENILYLLVTLIGELFLMHGSDFALHPDAKEFGRLQRRLRKAGS